MDLDDLLPVTGTSVKYVQVPEAQFMQAFMAAGRPEHMAKGVTEMFLSAKEFGWYGKKDISPSHHGLAQNTRSWEEFAKANLPGFSKVLA